MAAALAGTTSNSDNSHHGMNMSNEHDHDAESTSNEKLNIALKANRNAATAAEATSTRTSFTESGNSINKDSSETISFDIADESIANTGSDFELGLSTSTESNTTLSQSSSVSSAGNGCMAHDQDIVTPNIPQWKKELIQRRKANIARTIGANNQGICPKKVPTTTTSSPAMAAGTTFEATSPSASVTVPITPTSPVQSIAKYLCMESTATTKGKGSFSSVNDTNGLNTARTPDNIHHDASSGGHYTISGQLAIVDTSSINSSGSSSSPFACACSSHQSTASGQICAIPKTSCTPGKCLTGAGGGNIGNAGFISSSDTTKWCSARKSDAAGGTCLTTSPQNESTKLRFSSNSTNSRFHQKPLALDSVVLDPITSPHPQQLHSILDVERAADPLSLSLSPLSPQHLGPCNSIAAGTGINQCASSSSFIKNQCANKSTSKLSKYKSSSAKLIPNVITSTTTATEPANVHSVIPNVISNTSANNFNVSSVASSARNSQKMVAAQELSDTNDSLDDFDPTEELQYGPGIVSKLRCRYLSLALRQSAGKQRPTLDNLRRATSLNNLLDDDDRGSNSSCATATDHSSTTATHCSIRPSSEIMGKSPDEFVATFQKNLKLSDKRHMKRGNDSLKRARSVEALVVYGDKTWEHENSTITANGVPVQMRYSYIQRVDTTCKPDITPITSSTEVTIEDKISSARERASISDKPPTPKKISPFMDETERPPPDVVKQTLKIFEATANRRGRGLGRNNNCNGEVATKVRNYKSIISQEKPPIIFPKPPLSPKKNFRKPGLVPAVNLDIVAAKKIGNKHPQPTNSNNCNVVNGGKKGSSYDSGTVASITSPITNISMKFTSVSAQLANDVDAINNTAVESLASPTTIAARNVELKSSSPPVPSLRTAITSRYNAKNESTPIRTIAPFSESSTNNGGHSPSTPDVIPRKIFDSGSNVVNTIAAIDSPVSQLSKHLERLRLESPTTSINAFQSQLASGSVSPSLAAISPIEKLHLRSKRSASESDGDEADDYCDGDTLTKRISKSALDNISKAGTTQQFNFSSVNNKSLSTVTNNKLPTVNGNSSSAPAMTNAKQVGVIRPLVAEAKMQQHHQTTDIDSKLILKPCTPNNATTTAAAATPVASMVYPSSCQAACDNLVISNSSQQQQNANSLITNKTNNNLLSNNKCPSTTSIDDSSTTSAPPLPPLRPTLTTREIEKNLINTKKNEEANSIVLVDVKTSTALTTKTTTKNTNNSGGDVEGVAGTDNGVKWQIAKKTRNTGTTSSPNTQQQSAQNTMIFNFKDRKEVPDYIENDGLLFRRKRELPKPNESGFAFLGVLSLESSTDPDDEWTMGPPSPCDVEFENANIIIDGKSSIRSKTRDLSLRVQFDDTLTSTFEYPSETSCFDESTSASSASAAPSTLTTNSNDNKTNNMDNNLGHIVTASTAATTTVCNDYVAASTSSASYSANTLSNDEFIKSPAQKLLGNVNLGSAPLGSYKPMKAQMNSHFELGVTRPIDIFESSDEFRATTATTTTTNGNSSGNDSKVNGKMTNNSSSSSSKTNDVGYSMFNSNDCMNDEPESLQYLKPATDDLTIVYSEGTQKADLLY